jgi:hypothetical protein
MFRPPPKSCLSASPIRKRIICHTNRRSLSSSWAHGTRELADVLGCPMGIQTHCIGRM